MACETPKVQYFDPDLHISISYLREWLHKRYEQEMSEGMEHIQECYNEEDAELCFAKASAFQDVEKFLIAENTGN